MTLQERYQKAIKRIGGAAALLSLPEDVKKVLASVTDYEVKVKMLEAVAETMNK